MSFFCARPSPIFWGIIILFSLQWAYTSMGKSNNKYAKKMYIWKNVCMSEGDMWKIENKACEGLQEV